jgi:hypothetical protein
MTWLVLFASICFMLYGLWAALGQAERAARRHRDRDDDR